MKRWPIKPLREIAKCLDGQRVPITAEDRTQEDVPYYGASGIIDYVDHYLFDETALLIAEDGANLLSRSTPVAFIAEGKYWVNNHAHIVTENGQADLQYLCMAWNLRDISDFLTGSAQPKLNQGNMNRIPFLCPPLPLQRKFAYRVRSIREMETEQSRSAARLDDLFQSLLHEYFN